MDGYERLRRWNSDISGQQVVGTATGDTTLVTVKANHTIFLQHLVVLGTTGSAGKTWSVEDSAGTPVSISGSLPMDTAPVEYEIDYGPEGIALTAATNLVLNVSATGAAGHVIWTGYQRLTGVAAP